MIEGVLLEGRTWTLLWRLKHCLAYFFKLLPSVTFDNKDITLRPMWFIYLILPSQNWTKKKKSLLHETKSKCRTHMSKYLFSQAFATLQLRLWTPIYKTENWTHKHTIPHPCQLPQYQMTSWISVQLTISLSPYWGTCWVSLLLLPFRWGKENRWNSQRFLGLVVFLVGVVSQYSY